MAIISTLLTNMVYANQNIDPQLKKLLTDEELNYLQNTPTLTVQGETDFKPFNYTINGKSVGHSIELLNLLGDKMGVKFKPITGKTWSEYINMFEAGQIDTMVNIVNLPSRQRFAAFTRPYFEYSYNIITRKSEGYIANSKSSISNYRIAVVKDFSSATELQRILPRAKFVYFDSTLDALKGIADFKADVMVESTVVMEHYFTQFSQQTFEFTILPIDLNIARSTLSLASHKNNSKLRDILQKALSVISNETMTQLNQHWADKTHSSTAKVQLDQEQQSWLLNNNSLRVNLISDYQPFMYVNNGEKQGFTIELLNYIAQMLDINFDFVQAPWSQQIDSFRQGKLDLLVDVSNTKSRREFALFTQPYVSYKNVMVVSNTELATTLSLEDLNDKKLASYPGSAVSQYVEANYPDIEQVYFDSFEQAIQSVAEQTTSAHINNEIIINYILRKDPSLSAHTIPIQETKFNNARSHSIAVQPNNDILHVILNKALLAVPEHKMIELQNKWFGHSTHSFKPQIALNNQQRQWLLDNRLKIYLPALEAPLGQRSQNSYEGIVADFISHQEQMLGARWLPNATMNNGQNEVEMMQADITIGDPQDPKLQSTFEFSQPIITMPVVILTADNNHSYIGNLNNLKGSKIGILDSTHYHQSITQLYPELRLQAFENNHQAILAVSSGDIDVLLCPLVQCSYVMNELGVNNIKTVGITPYNSILAFAVNKAHPQLLEIINDVLAAMPLQQKNAIYKRWNSREDVIVKIDYEKTIAALLLVIIIAAVMFMVVHNRNVSRRAKEIELFAKETQKYADSVEQSNIELKTAQSKLVQAEKMASLGTLTAGVAHEINNPTNFMYIGVKNLSTDVTKLQQFFVELAGSDADEQIISMFDEQFKPIFEHLATISEGTERIKTIVQDLRAFSRVDNSKKEVIDITECIQSTINLVRTKYLEVAEILTDFSQLPAIACHPAQLNQVMMNLIVNACDAIDEHDHGDGKIVISTAIANNEVIIKVQDNGCGMNDLTRAKLFEPFYTTKAIGKGTGLGMSISFGIIEEHGGSMNVTSAMGQGSTIIVKLPITTA